MATTTTLRATIDGAPAMFADDGRTLIVVLPRADVVTHTTVYDLVVTEHHNSKTTYYPTFFKLFTAVETCNTIYGTHFVAPPAVALRLAPTGGADWYGDGPGGVTVRFRACGAGWRATRTGAPADAGYSFTYWPTLADAVRAVNHTLGTSFVVPTPEPFPARTAEPIPYGIHTTAMDTVTRITLYTSTIYYRSYLDAVVGITRTADGLTVDVAASAESGYVHSRLESLIYTVGTTRLTLTVART